MCNNYRLLIDASAIFDVFANVRVRIELPESIPNLEPRTDIRITDVAPIVRASASGAAELVQRRWSWPGANRKPVYNFRSDGREFTTGRCLIVADGFYEYTPPADARKKRKDKWLFTRRGAPLFGIAGLWRATADVGEAFTMLTMPPGPDVAPYHDRQIAILDPADWAAWLDPAVPAHAVLRMLPAGSLDVAQVTEPGDQIGLFRAEP